MSTPSPVQATANARPELKRIAHYVTEHPGGRGAVRDVCELPLSAQGYRQDLLKKKVGLVSRLVQRPDGTRRILKTSV